MAEGDAIGPIRRTATGILVALALVFALSFTVEDPGFTVLLIRSMAEAGMIGGLADWFAVEALFRHPLRLPIPHTALLPRNQKRAAISIARFIDEHFLVRDQVLVQVRKTNPARLAAAWLSDRSNAKFVAAELSFTLRLFLNQQLERGVRIGASPDMRAFLKDVAQPDDLSGTISAFLKETVRSRLMDDIIAEVRTVLDQNRDKVTEIVQERSRWWIASTVDRGFVKLLVDGILSIMDDLADRDSALRRDFDGSVVHLVDGIQKSGRIAAFIAEGQEKYLASPAFAAAIDALVAKVLRQIQDNLEAHPDGAADFMAGAIADFAESLLDDPALQDDLNERLVAAAGAFVEAARPAIVAYITQVIEEWESDDLVARVEREVGYDLQFIRINGAVLGALVGGVLHVITSAAH
ncbi:MAG: DUF445 domain-containing protein [Pseudomonadota bacterium]